MDTTRTLAKFCLGAAAVVAAVLAAITSPARAASAPCTPALAAGVKASPSQVAPVVAEINKERAAAGLAPAIATPTFTKMAAFIALTVASGKTVPAPNNLAADCGTGYNWTYFWGTNYTSGKEAADALLKSTQLRVKLLTLACSNDPSSTCAVGVGVAVDPAKGTSTWTIVADDSVQDDQVAADASDPTALPLWPIDGWPTIPTTTTTTLPAAGSGRGWTYSSGTRLCLTSSQCGRFAVDTTWRPTTPIHAVSVCITVDSWDDGSSAALTPRLGAATLSLHLDKSTFKIANPGWSAGASSSQSCADVSLPVQAPTLGRHSAWVSLTSSNGDELTSDEDTYGMPLVVQVFAASRARLVYAQGRPAYDLVSASVGSQLFALASASHPITVSCVEVRMNGSIRKVDSTVVLRKALGASSAARCTYRVKPPFGIGLEARVKMTPWLVAAIDGQKIRYGGVRFG